MDKKQCAMTRYLAEKNTLGPEISRDTILSLLDYIEALERDLEDTEKLVVIVARQRDDLLAAAELVVHLSDRKHDAWDSLKAAIANVKEKRNEH